MHESRLRVAKSVSDLADSDGHYPPARTRWTAVAVLLLLYGLAFLDRQVVSLMVGPIKHDLAISDVQIGLLQGVSFAVLYAAFGVPLGLAADRLSRRWVIFCGVFTWAVATTLSGLAHNFGQLLVARVFVGMGEGALAPAGYSIIADMFPKAKLTSALSVYSVGALIGAGASLALGGVVLQHATGGGMVPILGHLSS